jgi:hypothetical protein
VVSERESIGRRRKENQRINRTAGKQKARRYSQ